MFQWDHKIAAKELSTREAAISRIGLVQSVGEQPAVFPVPAAKFGYSCSKLARVISRPLCHWTSVRHNTLLEVGGSYS